MDKVISIALVGLSGFGSTHVNRFLDGSADHNIQIVAAVDVDPDPLVPYRGAVRPGVAGTGFPNVETGGGSACGYGESYRG